MSDDGPGHELARHLRYRVVMLNIPALRVLGARAPQPPTPPADARKTTA